MDFGRLRTLVATAALFVVAVACSGGGGEQTDALEAAEARWASAGISDYVLVVTNESFHAAWSGPFEVRVANAEVAEIRSDGVVIQPIRSERVDNDGNPFVVFRDGEGAPVPVPLFTVEGLFEEIRANLDADEMTVTYDAERGYPTRIFRDRDADDAADLTIIAVLTPP